MTTWPTASNLVAHMQHPNTPDGDSVDAAVGAANAHLIERTIFGASTEETPAEIHEDVHLAALLLAAKLYARRNSPDGVAGGADFGPYHITRTDPDVVTLIKPHLRIPLVIV